ncbi:MAG: malto-oligosyltrehalose synthase, partial [Actinobacteria bacterium]|nr:malto-oligosyltrehalose synthase [Actinomycetota bacterium]
VWVEKILEPAERLRDWPVDGTTGYEFLNEVCALFVDPAGEEPLTALYEEIAGEARGFHEVADECKLREATTTFAEDVERLQPLLPGLGVDVPAALASLPVYRTYVEPDTAGIEDADRAALEEAGLPAELARVLLLEERGHDAFVLRFQQTTPPVHAKGVEDTAFYRWNRLLALNEVGGDPARFSVSVAAFHRSNVARLARFPLHLLSTMTHDAKRSADVRARLACLAGMADEWASLVRPRLEGWRDANEAYLILQTIVGAWPLDAERLEQYVEKALREAKVHTSWIQQDHEWEAGAKAYAVGLLEDEELGRFSERLAARGERVSLGMVLLKLTCPGLPDIYQGDELPFFALVDPDNRRPVDWAERRRALASAEPPAKLDLIRRTLALRARRPEAFAGSYRPLEAGPDTCAFLRGGDVKVAVALRGELNDPAVPGEWLDVHRTPTLVLSERVEAIATIV